jgi:hypothetical protein
MFFRKCNEKKKKELEHDFFKKKINNNFKMKNLKFLTTKGRMHSLEKIHELILNYMI